MAERRRIAIVGAGALGLYYGARLARAGREVRFLLRSDLAAVRASGRIAVREPAGDFEVSPVAAFGTTTEIGPVDLVVLTLKTTANGILAEVLPPLMGAGTVVLTLQNGLGSEAAVAEVVGAERVLGGLGFIGVNRVDPGVVQGVHTPGMVALGEMAGPATARCRDIADTFTAAGVPGSAVESLREARWRKLVWNVPFNGLAVTEGGLPCDVLLSDAGRARTVRAVMAEVQAVAAAEGVVIPDAFLDDNVERTRSMAYRPSTLVDHVAGRPLEVEAIWGEPLRRARAAGVATPRLAALYEQLREVSVG